MMAFVSRNERMLALLAQADRLANSDHTLLLLGESGTGKERLALYIHRHSARAQKPFVKVDCTTVPENLWESELFGYVRGAFTGANREGKPGKLEMAAGGTLFLDEIGELPLPIQAKLLRFLQEKSFEPVGAVKTRQVDVRVIAATNKNLRLLLNLHHFREDLYYRLNVLSLTLPPLRERREDIQSLVREILVRESEKAEPPELTAEAMAALLLHDWPGNIRELENALKRALLLSEPGSPLSLSVLPPEVAGCLQPSPPPQLMRRYVKSAELLLIRWALDACGNDRSKAARFLGLSRAALYKKMAHYPEFQSGSPSPGAAEG
ncbi:MAG: sigma-54 interaction domain-containing protein [Mycobacterium leprae]